jgi:hypothetical protein
MVDFSNGLVSTYECQLCCPRNFYDSRLVPGSMSGYPGYQEQFIAQERTQDCHGNIWPWDTAPYAISFNSDDWNIADISFGGLCTPIAPGSTTISASWESVVYFKEQPESPCSESPMPTESTASCDVQGPDVTLPDNLVAVGKNFSVKVNIDVSPTSNQTPITLSLRASSGTGEARFRSSNSTTLTITQSSEVEIIGVTESRTANNMLLEAKAGNEALAGKSFTVVAVTLSLRTSGQFSADNARRGDLAAFLGSDMLGTRLLNGTGGSAWGTVVEIVGVVKPSNFTGELFISRGVVASRTYQGSTLLPSLNIDNATDNTPPNLRDDDPQPNGNIYDADGPTLGLGLSPPPDGTIFRKRTNFNQFVISRTGIVTRVSADLNWYSRLSIIRVSGGFQLSNTIPGDNVAATGATNLSWDLR